MSRAAVLAATGLVLGGPLAPDARAVGPPPAPTPALAGAPALLPAQAAAGDEAGPASREEEAVPDRPARADGDEGDALSVVSRELAACRQRSTLLEEALADLSANACAAERSTIASLRAEIETLRGQVEALRGQVGTLEGELRACRSGAREAGRTNERLGEELRACRQRAAEADDTRAAALERRISDLEKALARTIEEVETMRGELADTRDALDIARQDIARLETARQQTPPAGERREDVPAPEPAPAPDLEALELPGLGPDPVDPDAFAFAADDPAASLVPVGEVASLISPRQRLAADACGDGLRWLGAHGAEDGQAARGIWVWDGDVARLCTATRGGGHRIGAPSPYDEAYVLVRP